MKKNTLIEGKAMCKSFATTKDNILNNVNIKIYEGDFTVIMGASGSGKSTLLYALSGMDNINSGEVFYKNAKISNYKEKQMAQLRREEFGFVFQQIHLVSNLTLFENVVVAGYLSKKLSGKEVNEKANELFVQMNIKNAKERLPHETSGGEGQRAAIARGIIHNPGIVFADEPTGALNKKSSEEILNILQGLNAQGQSVLMVTHDMRAAAYATRLLYLEDGKILDEMCLDLFVKEEAKAREEKITKWLSTMAW